MKHVNVALFVPHLGCPNQCSFCNQKAISGSRNNITPADVDSAARTALKNPASSGGEIAFFGGSFTAIDRKIMLSLLEAARKYIADGSFKGIRISTRPDAIDNEICDILKAYGVTAVELGAQSMDDGVLLLNRRGHTANDVVNASKMLKERGFELGLQMMTGLYGSTAQESIETAKKIIELKPDTVRIYPTAVLEHTRLAELYRGGEYRPQTVEEAAEVCAELLIMFHSAGIKVIRTGLHSGGGVEGELIAGAYHPAFKELCEGKIYLNKALAELNGLKKGSVELHVSPKSVSQMTGQKKINIAALSALGYRAKIIADPAVEKHQVKVISKD